MRRNNREDHGTGGRGSWTRATAIGALLVPLALVGGCQQGGGGMGGEGGGGGEVSPILGTLGGAGAGALAGRLIAGSHDNTAAMLGGALIGGLGGLLGTSAYDKYKGQENQTQATQQQLAFSQNQLAQQEAVNRQLEAQRLYGGWGQSQGYYAPPINAPADVTQAQRLLKGLGLYNGPADGLNGPSTSAAVVRFQNTQGLPATGEVTPALVQQLRQAI